MRWDEFTDAAAAISWVAYLGTVTPSGEPHVAVVAPGFRPGVIWCATRPSSQKFINLRANPSAMFHWPVQTGSGPGELIARGRARLHEGATERGRLWEAGVVPFDLSMFWKGPDDPDLAFVETTVTYARLLDASFTRHVWRPGAG